MNSDQTVFVVCGIVLSFGIGLLVGVLMTDRSWKKLLAKSGFIPKK